VINPTAIAIDARGNVWVADGGHSTISELSSTGEPITTSGMFESGLYGPDAIAIDAAGNVWVANSHWGIISEFSSSGEGLSGPNGYHSGAALYGFSGIATDSSGNVWVVGNSLGEFIGLARPALTPLVACLTKTPPAAVCLP